MFTKCFIFWPDARQVRDVLLCPVLSCRILEVEDLFFTSLLMHCDCVFVALRYTNCVVLSAEELKGDYAVSFAIKMVASMEMMEDVKTCRVCEA